MLDQKHFNYESHVVLGEQKQQTEIEILNIEFLTPARVSLEINGKKVSYVASVDLVNRMVYDEHGRKAFFSDKFFDHLDKINELPEDFFAAPADVVEQASQATENHQQTQQDLLGEYNG